MRITKLRGMLRTERKGVALIIMVLLIIVFCALIWLDPMALIHGEGSGMPWGEEYRLVRSGEEVEPPGEGQPEISDNLAFNGSILEEKEVKGKVEIYISTDGRVTGVWGGIYKPEPNIIWEVAGSRFKGNIDPSKIYIDESGEDTRRLYFIAKGKSLILVTNSETDRIKTASSAIYVTGWLDNDYNAVGKVTITSDKKTYWEYPWQAKAEKTMMIPDFGRPLPGLY
jgi:hypothetical protein